MRDRGLADTKHRSDVDIEGLDPLFVGDFFQRLVIHLERGVVDQHIDTAKFSHRLAHDVFALLLLGQITRQQQTLPASFFDPALGFFRVFMLVQVRDCNLRAFSCKGYGDSATDAAIGTGDPCNLALQVPGALVAFFAAIRIRVHLTLQPWNLLRLTGKRWLWVFFVHLNKSPWLNKN